MTHPLLGRQLKRLGLTREQPPSDTESWCAFLDRVEEIFTEADEDRYTLERSLSISSEEMRELYDSLKHSSETALAAERDKLAKTAASLEATLAAAEDGILFVDEHGHVVAHNDSFRTMWGTPLEIPRAGGDDIAARIARRGVRDPAAWLARVQQYYANPLMSGHDELELTDGRVVTRFTAPVITKAGAIVGRVWFFRDVTATRRLVDDLREANRFLDSIVENIPDMVFVKRADDLSFVRLNRAGEALLGLEREGVIGKTDYDLFPAERAADFQRADREVLELGVELHVATESLSTETMGVRTLSTKKIPIIGDGGTRDFVLGITRDITEIEQAQQELWAAKEAAEAAARAKADFLANMSHELRTPLNAIVGFSRILARSPSLNAREQDQLAYVVKAADHMLSLVNDLLDLRAVEERPIQRSSVDPIDSVQEALDLVRAMLDERSLAVSVSVEAPSVLADPMALTQVLVNLLSNAAKFTERGGHIEVAAREDCGRVAFVVRDDGIGITEADQSRLFTYYEQLGARQRHEFKGSGIGLALTKKLVESLGGTIRVESSKGTGTTFSFDLPRVEEAQT